MTKFPAMRIPQYWLYIFLLSTIGLFFFYQENQPTLSYDFAPQFDGNDYRDIYEFFTDKQQEYEVSFPFHARILIPWLAAQINSGDIIQDFQWVNLLFTLLSVWVLFQLWRMLGFELRWFIVGFCWLLLHWTGMIRLNAFDPITVDVALFFVQGLLLIIILKRKFYWLILLGPLATLQKESFIALQFVLLIYGWYHNKREDEDFYRLPWIGAALILSVLTKYGVDSAFAPVEEGRGSVVTLLYHARETFLHPFDLVRWLLAAFVAFGPLLLAGAIKAIRYRYYDNRRNLFILFSLVYFSFGILAGGDMTRIIYLGFPFVMTWLLWELRELKGPIFWLILLLSLPLTLLTNTIPDPAFEWEKWQSWYPEFATLQTIGLYVAYWVICLVIVLWKRKTILNPA